MKRLRLLAKHMPENIPGWEQVTAFIKNDLGGLLSTGYRAIRRWSRPYIHRLQQWMPWEDVSSSLRTKNTTIRQSTTSSSRSAGRSFVSRHTPFHQIQIAVVLAVLLLTAALGQRFYNQPTVVVDSLAPETYVATRTVSLIDEQTTEAKRQQARTGAIEMLMVDPQVTRQLRQKLNALLGQANDARSQVAESPELLASVLPPAVQVTLSRTSEKQWTLLWSLVQLQELTVARLQQGNTTGTVRSQLSTLSPEQLTALEALLRYRERNSLQALRALGGKIQSVRLGYGQAVTLLLRHEEDSLPVWDAKILELPEADWQTLQQTLRLVQDRMLMQGIAPGMRSEALLQRAIDAQLAGTDIEPSEIAARVLMATLDTNLVVDAELTRLRAEQAVEQVKPETVTAEAGEIIVRRGEPITQQDFVLLDHFGLTRRRFNWAAFVGFGALVGLLTALFLWVDHTQSANLRQSDHVLVLVLVLGIAGLAALNLPTLGLPAVGLLLGSFYGMVLAVALTAILVLLLVVGANLVNVALFAGAIAAFVGAWMAPKLRSREELALLGGFVGLAQGLSFLVLTLMFNTVSASALHTVFTRAALQALYGIAWSIVALGVSPYLESVFDVVTPIRLAELSNPNRPLLKRLAAEAPGTFQHTMFVANLAEAAARALNHNVELVRAGTLYHDIGKMHDPQGFIENQMGGPNKHDAIDDPWISADIIKKHVTEGLVMARKHRLPRAIRAFIPEHQGTMLISYFYHQAQERAAQDPTITVKEADFRYAGPIPQSPETGIVMLADSCEAALRSLSTEATLEEAYAMVNRILRARWKDNQLVNCCLSRSDMTVIANIFVQVWQQYNHKRIAYPKGALAPR